MAEVSAFGVVHKAAGVPKKKDASDEVAGGLAGAAGARVGASAGSGGEVGFKNTLRAANHHAAEANSASFLKQGRAALRTRGMGRAGLGALAVGGVAGVGAKKATEKWQSTDKRAKKKFAAGGALAAAGGAALAVKGGHNYKLFTEAKQAHNAMKDAGRAQKLGRDLAGVSGNRSNFDIKYHSGKAMRQPHNNTARTAAERLNADTPKLRRSFDEWSRSRSRVNSYRDAVKPGAKEPSKLRGVIDPKARNYHQARALDLARKASPQTNKTLFRASDFHKDTDFTPGSTIDVHHMSSWSGDKRISDSFTNKQRTRKSKVPFLTTKKEQGDSKPALMRLKNAQGLHGAPLSRHFTQDEWITGGKLKVVNHTFDRKSGRHILDVEHHKGD